MAKNSTKGHSGMDRTSARTTILLSAILCFGAFQQAVAVSTNVVAAGVNHVLTVAENVADDIVLLNNGSTLKVTPDLGGGNVELKVNVKIAENAAATLAVDTSVSSLRLLGGLYALDGASLAVSGIGTISMGKNVSAAAINTPPLDIATLTFDDTSATGLVLVDSVTVRKAPTTCPLSISSGANVALMGTDTLAPFGITGDVTLSDFDLVLLNNTAIATNRTITVMPGRTVSIKPCNKNGDWAWAGRAGLTSYAVPRIVLGGTGARCVFRNIQDTIFTSCPVSGQGDVVFKPDSSSFASTLLYGPFEYDGVFAVDNASYVQTYTHGWGAGTRSLRLANNAIYRPNGIVSFSSIEVGVSATLELLFNSNLTIGDVVSGTKLSITAASMVGGGHVDFTGSFPRPFTIETDGTAFCRFNGGDPTNCIECASESGIVYRWPDASGVIDCAGLSLGRGHSHATLFSDGAVLTNLSPSVAVSAKGSAVVATTANGASVRSEAGSSVSYVSATADWQSNAFLWIDPSADQFLPVGRQESNRASVGGTNIVFAYIADVRPSKTTYSFYNTRDTGTNKTSINWQVFPLAVPGGCNGLTTISLGPYQKSETLTYKFDDGSADITKSATSARRILLAKNKDTAAANGPQYVGAVTMVFGSQNGGGEALVGTINGAFCRSGHTLNDGITTNRSHRIFLNGQLVADPTTQKLSGGWDVITLEMEGEKFSALGWGGCDGKNNDYNHSGGQNYCEIIVFASVPTDAQRISAEKYLAGKWGLASKYGVVNDLVLSGSGTVRTDGTDANVSGRFSGTIDLAGGTLNLAPRGSVPDETSVPTAALLGWFDPDDEDNILLNKDTDHPDAATEPDRLWAIYDKSRSARSEGDAALFGSRWRRPRIRRAAHGNGPVRNWIHFDSEDNLRFVRLPVPDLMTEVVSAVPLSGVREIFVVQDSSRGGGTPIIDLIRADNLTAGMKILPRRTAYAYAPIWPNISNGTFVDATITGGVTRLNGTAVDGNRAGFTGRDEVFSFTTTSAYAPAALADIYNASVAGVSGAYEMIGETLFFSEVLSEQDRTNVIAYLNAKWRGVLPDGCGDFSGATVTGSGNVRGANLSSMPKPSLTFTGSVVASSNADCAFTVSPTNGTVTGAIVAPGTTFGLPAVATATVNIAGRMPSGRMSFDLIDCAGFANSTTWTLNLLNGRNAHGNLKVQGGKLILEISGPGALIIFR